ncbi:hypothetical protein GCM10010435_36810 [Winogradskya consettensis]|uniref:Protein kinase domain-containing protein n=1 Tax=Winogradskya consettensis TaxID=113560 RepID=A0A919T1R4_9ACTN|nr:serine/threonine-protein kinase [Actinoplanes consettensis]GIM81610.1 hypothetical protein Aco04nite_77440 [Actinoplanes consettensis]
MARLAMGTTLLERYVLLGVAGQGGVSTVYRAVDVRFGRLLAVKLLAAAHGDDPRPRETARREALITDRLRHPGVPRVYEYGDAPLPDGSTAPYLALELLNGIPLADRLTHSRLDWPEAAHAAALIADVLAVAHEAGIVHRDLTTRNVMLTPTGPKIIDFGLATPPEGPVRTDFAGAGARPDGGAGARVLAHPRTRSADPAEDVYSLGVVLYEMLTGRSPYPPHVAAMIMAAGRAGQLAPTPVLAVVGLPPELRDLVRACMAKRPEDRPPSAEVALRLRQIQVRPPAPSIN